MILRGGGSGSAPRTPRLSRKKQRIRPLGRAALGASSPGQPSFQSRLPSRWNESHEWRPGTGGESPTVGEPLRCVEAGDFEINPPGPKLARHLREWWDQALGEMAIPLSPGRVRVVGKVERVDSISVLPAVVRRRLTLRQWLRTGVGVLEPEAANGDCRDAGGHLRRRRDPRGRRSAARPR